MKKQIVVDSTCLISLEKSGYLDVLSNLFEPILIPPAVKREFGISIPWLQIQKPSDISLVLALKLSIDEGEAEAIALAHETDSQILLDDRKARSTAEKIGLRVIGTLGILILAKRQNLYHEIKPIIEALESNGFYISQALREDALRIVGE